MNIRIRYICILSTLLFAGLNVYSQPHLISPNGSEHFRPGQTITVRWEGIAADVVVGLEYTTDNGESWQGITSQATGLQYQWQVPDSPSDRCLVRLVHTDAGTICTGHPRELSEAAFSHDERHVVAVGASSVLCWNVESKQVLWQSDSMRYVKVHPSSSVLVGNNDRKVAVRDLMTGAVVKTLTGHTGIVGTVRYSPDGAFIATSSFDRTARLWNGQSGELIAVLAGHKAEVRGLRFSGNSAKVVTQALDSTLKIWNTGNGQLIRTIKSATEQVIWTTALNPTGDPIVVIESFIDTVMTVRDVATGGIQHQLKGTGYVYFSPNGQQIVTGNIGGGALVYNAFTGSLLFSLGQHTGFAHRAAYSDDGKLLATVDTDGGLNVWNAETGEFIRCMIGHTRGAGCPGGIVASVEFSKDSKRLLTAGCDKTVRIWDLENTQQTTDISDATFTIWPSTLALTQIDMRTVAYGLSRDSVITTIVRNPDNQPLRVENFRITGKDSSSFSLLPDMSPIEVPAGGSADLKLRFTPSGAGPHEAMLEMNTSEALKIALHGEGKFIPLLPQLHMIDFGKREISVRVDTTVGVVRNMTEKDIRIDTVVLRGWYRLSPLIGTRVLPPGGVLDVRIEFRPTSLQEDTRPLWIIYEGQDQELDTVEVLVHGEGVAPASVETGQSIAGGLSIHPNPAYARGVVEFTLEKAGIVHLAVQDMLGCEVYRQELGILPEGVHRHEMDLRLLGSGSYLLVVETPAGRMSRSLRIVR